MNEKSAIIGAGTYGQTYASYLTETGIEIIGFIDDDPRLWGREIMGIPVIGDFESLKKNSFKEWINNIYCPIGDNLIRERYLSESKKLGYNIPNFVHPTAVVGPDVQLGEANYILAGSAIMPHTVISDYVMVSIGSTVGHHVTIEKSVFISSGVNIGANLTLKEYAYIGIGATIMSNIDEIGRGALIGAGSVIIRSVEPEATMVGNPGRSLVKQH